MTIVEPAMSAAAVQSFIESVPEIKDFIDKEMNCQKKGIEILKSYSKFSRNYVNMVRGFVLSTVLLLLDVALFDMQYSILLSIIMISSLLFIIGYRIYKFFSKRRLTKNYSDALKEFGEVKNARNFVALLELEEFYKNYEEIKEMQKEGDLTFATKESEETIFIKNKNETKSFVFGKFLPDIVRGKELVFKVLDDEFFRLKNIISVD